MGQIMYFIDFFGSVSFRCTLALLTGLFGVKPIRSLGLDKASEGVIF